MRIAPHVRRTPVVTVDGADFGLPGTRLVFKLEFLQHAGSFKTRGAFNQLLTLHMGGDVMVAVKAKMRPQGDLATFVDVINRIEDDFKKRFPQTHWIFFEPDVR